MSPDADIAPERMLAELAELSLSVARDVAEAIHTTQDPSLLAGLVTAYARVARSVRMCVALSMRLRRGERMAAREAAEPEDREEADPDEGDVLEERPEREERESPYDRLPSGDLPTQVATVARGLNAPLRVLPAVMAKPHRSRVDCLVARAPRPLPLRPLSETPSPVPAGRLAGAVAVSEATRSRGPP